MGAGWSSNHGEEQWVDPPEDECEEESEELTIVDTSEEYNARCEEFFQNAIDDDQNLAPGLRMIQQWTANGTDVNVRGDYGQSLLHCIVGAADRYCEFVKPLIDAGALLEARDNLDQTPLHEACFGQHFGCVRKLLQEDAVVTVADKHGMTPLHQVCASISNTYDNDGRWILPQPSLLIVKALVDKGADIFARDNGNETPYDWSNKIVSECPGYAAVIKYFLNHYAQLLCEEHGDLAIVHVLEIATFSADGLFADLPLGKVPANQIEFLKESILAKQPDAMMPYQEPMSSLPPDGSVMDIPRQEKFGHQGFYVIRFAERPRIVMKRQFLEPAD